jgi:5-carboxymethyl-2-hydroxymuconate isomerase
MFTGVFMPHCIIEHSSSLNGKSLVSLVYSGALKTKLFEVDGSDIKVRALPFSNYQTGNSNIDFIHVTLKILSGRNTEQKSKLSGSVIESLEELSLDSCSISVEVVDIDRDSYCKVVV